MKKILAIAFGLVANLAHSQDIRVKGQSQIPLSVETSETIGAVNYQYSNTQFAGSTFFSNYGLGLSSANNFQILTNNTPRFGIDADGRTFVGTSSGTYRFSVRADEELVASFARNGLASDNALFLFHGSNFLNSSSSLFSFTGLKGFAVRASNNMFFGTAQNTQMYLRSSDGFVGIGNTNPTENLDVTGSIKSRNLAYNTTVTDELRPVYANKDGVLKPLPDENTTKYVSVSNLSLQQNPNIINSNGYSYFASGFSTMYLPLQLPDNATLTNGTLRILNNTTQQFYFYITRRHVETLFAENIAEALTTNMILSYVNLNFTFYSPLYNKVDNSTYTYYISATSANWQGANQRFSNAKIGYTFK